MLYIKNNGDIFMEEKLYSDIVVEKIDLLYRKRKFEKKKKIQKNTED